LLIVHREGNAPKQPDREFVLHWE